MSTDRPIKLSPRLPKGEANGLDAIYDLVKGQNGSAYVIMRVHADKVVRYPGGVLEPVLTIERLEGLPQHAEGDDSVPSLAAQGGRLLLAARQYRLGDDEPDLYDGGVLKDDDEED